MFIPTPHVLAVECLTAVAAIAALLSNTASTTLRNLRPRRGPCRAIDGRISIDCSLLLGGCLRMSVLFLAPFSLAQLHHR